MKKMLITLLIALMTLGTAIPVFAQTAADSQLIALPHLPEDAVFLDSEPEENGFTELTYWSESTHELYEITVDPASQTVRAIEIDLWDGSGSHTVQLSEDEAKALLIDLYPDAVIDSVRTEEDDGLFVYKLLFTTPEFFGRAEMNPETGIILERELDYETPHTAALESSFVSFDKPAAADSLTAAQAKAAVLGRLTNGTITEFKADKEDGRDVYEGEAVDGRYEYEFEIDAVTGAFLDWDVESLND